MTKNNRCFITKITKNNRIFDLLLYLDANDRPMEIHPYDATFPTLVGNIYIARVENVMPQMQSAFLKSGDLTFFCPFDAMDTSTMIFTKKNGKPNALIQGDELLVQVTRDAIKSKEICVTTNISFSSEHLLLTTGNSIHGISRKINGASRSRLQTTFLDEITQEPLGIVVRTSAKDCDASILFGEYHTLCKQVQDLISRARHLLAGQTLLLARHPIFSHLDRLQKEDLLEIVTDDAVWFERLQTEYPAMSSIRLYNDPSYSLQQLYGIEHMLDAALQKKVYLPSGGYLIIEPTEALTVIDVNSGHNVKKKKQKDYYLANNLEAATEIARQIRLRNISGIIIVDFINLKDQTQKDQLISYMKSLLITDYVKANVVDFTRLHLMEITRAKKYASLQQILGDCMQ